VLLDIKNYNTVKYHIMKLEEHEMIITRKDPSRPRLILCYPLNGAKFDLIYLSKAEKVLVQIVEGAPGISRRDLKKRWGLSQAYLTRTLKELEEKKVIRSEGKLYFTQSGNDNDHHL